VKRRWAAWVRFVSERESGLTLALFRIAVGLIAFVEMLETVLYGVARVAWLDKSAGGAFALKGNWLIQLLGGASPATIYGLLAVSMITSVCVAAGLGGRLVTFVALQSYGAVANVNGSAAAGYDALITNAMWILVIGGASSTLSLDSRIRRGAFYIEEATVPAIARRLAIFQLLVVYGMTGLQKLSPVWTPAGGYSALYWVYQEPTWRRFDMSWTASVYPIFQIATAISWHWELGAWLMFLYYWYRATPERPGRLRRVANRFDLRKPYLAIGVALHAGIFATLAVGPFSFICVAYYLAFMTPVEAKRALARRRSLPPGDASC
jgi:hypothetical protein